VAEVAAALDDVPDDSHRHEMVFRTSGVIPSAAGLGGSLIGALAPAPSAAPVAPVAGPAEPPLAVEGYDGMNPLVIRTDFTDEDAWDQVVGELRAPWVNDDPSYPYLISDPRYAGAPAERVLQDVRGPVRLGPVAAGGRSSSPTATRCTRRDIRCWPCRPSGTVNPSHERMT
jgi:hypothetical protein